MTEDWRLIHKNFDHKHFGEFNKDNWESNGFNYHQTETWIKVIGLGIMEHNFAWWLVNKQNKILEQLDYESVKRLREELEQEWKSVHKDFSSDKIIIWIKKGFDIQETKQWIEAGLSPNESDFANYLKQKKHNFSTINIEAQRKQYCQAQKWLDWNYPQEQRKDVRTLDLKNKNLVGSLKLEGFSNLERLDCFSNQITSLDCSNCQQLKTLSARWNRLTSLNLTNCPNITKLFCNRNFLTSLDFLSSLDSKKLECINISSNNFAKSDLNPFRSFINLKELGLGNWKLSGLYKSIYSHFYGSLEPLKDLTKLEELDIAGTDIDSGWEYLPESIHIFYCFAENSSKSRVEIIANELRKYGKTNEDKDRDDNFAILLGRWRENIKGNVISDIPTEKLYLIRNNIERFFYKWGGNEIKDLKVWSVRNDIYSGINAFVQWTNRTASVVGGSLLLVSNKDGNEQYNQTGGVIAVVAPFVEVVTSSLGQKLSEEKKRKWEEFTHDAESLFAACRDLENSIPAPSLSYLSKLNKVLKGLDDKTYYFLKYYDEDKNQEINDYEWEIARKQFPNDLKDNWEKEMKKSLIEIVKAMENLEKIVKEIRQGIFYELSKTEGVIKVAKEQIEKLLQKNNLEITDLNPDLWKDSASWEEYLQKLTDSQQISEFVKQIKDEIKKQPEKVSNSAEEQKFSQEVVVDFRN